MGKRVFEAINDLPTTHPELASQWHPTKNLPARPETTLATTTKKIWWLCEKGHEWQAVGESRAKGTGCPFCAGNKVLDGYNDLETTHPLLAAQWHPTKNSPLTARSVIAGTSKQIWWLCEKSHVWSARGSKRVLGQGCPVCAGRAILPGQNDLATTRPDLVREWHAKRNSILPSQIGAGSGIKVWWSCANSHQWEASPSQRTAGSGCPVCSGQLTQTGVNDLATTHPKLASQWHPTKNRDSKPTLVMAGTNKKIWWLCEKGHEWQAVGANRLKGSGCPYCAGQRGLAGFNDLESKFPELSEQWHPTANGSAKPSSVVAGSGKPMWWICDLGHEWKAGPHQRALGAGCPVCSGRVAWTGFNDLASTHPELAIQWHPIKNRGVDIAQVIAGSNKKFWWVCELGHEWQATGNHRVSGRGCPECATSGFDPGKAGVFYFIQNVSLSARKVGITNLGTDRLSYFEKQGWTVVATQEDSLGGRVRQLEGLLLSWIRHDLGLPVFLTAKQMGRRGGWTETFAAEGPTNQEVVSRVRQIYELCQNNAQES